MKIVFRFPFQRMNWVSALSPEAARTALSKQVGEGRGNPKPFRGRLDGPKFRMSRVINYRNAFLPVVYGELREVAHGRTQVDVVMRAPLPTLVFMTVWFAGIISVVSRVLLEGTEGAGNGFWLVAPFFLFGVSLTGFAFGSEAVQAERLLKQMLPEEPNR